MKTTLAVVSLALAFALPASAQLTVTSQATSNPALALQADGALLGYLQTNAASFTSAGLTFFNIGNPMLGDYVIGSGDLGTYFADVSYLQKESVDRNFFGVQDGYGTSVGLYTPYDDSQRPASFHLSSATYTTVDFWHADQVAPFLGTYWQDDPASFRAWEAVDVEANRIYTIFGIDDRRSQLQDWNDGSFLITRNLNPIALEPVPEPSTYGILGAAALLGLALIRRRRK